MMGVVNKLTNLKRGSIIKVSFDPVNGHEQSGYRPALVITDAVVHKATGSALCLPITTKKKDLLFEIDIHGKRICGVALPHQARSLDLRSRDFRFVELADISTIQKAQTILTKMINEE